MTGNHHSGGKREGAGRKRTLTEDVTNLLAIDCWRLIDELRARSAKRRAYRKLIGTGYTREFRKFLSGLTREERRFWVFASDYQREFGSAEGTYNDREAKARKSLKSKLRNLVLVDGVEALPRRLRDRLRPVATADRLTDSVLDELADEVVALLVNEHWLDSQVPLQTMMKLSTSYDGPPLGAYISARLKQVNGLRREAVKRTVSKWSDLLCREVTVWQVERALRKYPRYKLDLNDEGYVPDLSNALVRGSI